MKTIVNNRVSRKARRLNMLRLRRQHRKYYRQRLIATLQRGYVDASIGVSWVHMDDMDGPH